MFDNHPGLSASTEVSIGDELDRYLALATEDVPDSRLLWWIEQHKLYHCLSCMALDYLTIPHTFFHCLHLNLCSYFHHSNGC